MNPHYVVVAERAQHRCEYCHAPEIIFNFQFEVDHVVPLARGGSDDPGNLALACRACNLFKSDFESGDAARGDAVVALFHPRHDAWPEHFHVELESAEVTGLTQTGRATVARLRMNRPRQIAARHRWIELGLFPST